MLNRQPNPQIVQLQAEIDYVYAQFRDYPPESPEYKEMVERMSTLYDQIAKIPTGRLSPDIIATITANLLGIAMVVGHERANVIGGKAITFVKQLGR